MKIHKCYLLPAKLNGRTNKELKERVGEEILPHR
jgi:hypothetical protein